ncbi:MAG: VWA domain-containing protein [Deltaproteobacteria bacterium]|nr:VWA domain-containing protein [Deltaproteobacteria bacterium]
MRNPWIGRFGLVAALVPGLAACNSHPLKQVELKSEQEKDGNVSVAINRDVDILFVIDNSRSMALEQGTLARNFGPLLERLELPDVKANYRIAVTTTDNGGTYCIGKDAGDFKAQSCLSRAVDFQTTTGEDYFDVACADVCNHEQIEILPSKIFQNAEEKPRPWIENIAGVTNIGGDVSPVEAFQCLGPQGVTGCGFESPLESMRLGLLQANEDVSSEYGFMRPGAILAVVFVTDEADCSARYGEVPDPWLLDGSRALWSEENRNNGDLTSEVCWYAGVECEQSPDGSQECWAVDKKADGSETDSEDDAVLYPLARYTAFMDEIQERKRKINPDQDVLVAVLTGVPTDYDGGRIHYGAGPDPQFVLDHGIGAGCDSVNGKAAPPVRLAEFASQYKGDESDVNLFSVCDGDYTKAMETIAEAIGKQVRPPCVETCVADEDPSTPGLQHACQVEEEYITPSGATEIVQIPRCITTDDGFEFPEGADVCYRSLTDFEERTESSVDDMSATCSDEGWNLELSFERRDNAPPPAGARVQARCSVSRFTSSDCPSLTA